MERIYSERDNSEQEVIGIIALAAERTHKFRVSCYGSLCHVYYDNAGGDLLLLVGFFRITPFGVTKGDSEGRALKLLAFGSFALNFLNDFRP